jgi:hypothetical protein
MLSQDIPVHHAMNTVGGVEVYIREFLTSTKNGRQSPASRSGRFICGDIAAVPTGQGAGWGPEPVWTLQGS